MIAKLYGGRHHGETEICADYMTEIRFPIKSNPLMIPPSDMSPGDYIPEVEEYICIGKYQAGGDLVGVFVEREAHNATVAAYQHINRQREYEGEKATA